MTRAYLTIIFLTILSNPVMAEILNLELICQGKLETQVKMPKATEWSSPASEPFSERLSIVNSTWNGLKLVVSDTKIYIETPTETNGGILKSFYIDRLTGKHNLSFSLTLDGGRAESGTVTATCHKLDPKKKL